MGNTCSRIIRRSLQSLRRRSAGFEPLRRKDSDVEVENNRVRSCTFSINPLPTEIENNFKGENNVIISLVEICIRCICKHPECWEQEDYVQSRYDLFSKVPEHLVQQIFQVLVKHRMLNDNSILYFHNCSIPTLKVESYDISDGMMQVFATFEHVKEVNFMGFANLLDDKLLLLLNSNFGHSVEQLKLSGCRKLTDKSVVPLIESFSQSLNTLWLSDCSLLTQAIIPSIKKCEKLLDLRLCRCDNIVKDAYKGLSTVLPNLYILDISQCFMVDDSVLESLVYVSHGRAVGAKLKYSVDYKLSSLDLGWSSISSGAIPTITGFKQLKRLDVSNTTITRESLEVIAHELIYLEELSVLHCSRIGTNFKMLNGLIHLTQLEMDYVPVSVLPTKLHDLKHLSCSNCGITDLQLEVVGDTMQQLKYLNLDGCPVTNYGLKCLSSLHELKELYLSDVAIGDPGIKGLGTCVLGSIESIDLFGSNLTKSGYEMISKTMTNLKSITIDSLEMTDSCLQHICTMPQLVELDLFSAAISDFGCAYLGKGQLNQLTRLEMCGGGITDHGVEHICKLKTLEILNLTNNKRITKNGIETIANTLYHLRVLDISHIAVGIEGVEKLLVSNKIERLTISGCIESPSDEWMTNFHESMPNLWHIVY